jgi:hypothetical protein
MGRKKLQRDFMDMDDEEDGVQIPWNDNEPLVLHLFDCVQKNGAHFASGTEATKKWDRVEEEFWSDPITAPFRQLRSEPEPGKHRHRKLRLKYAKIVKMSCKKMGWNGNSRSNLSAELAPDVSATIRAVQGCLQQIEEYEERLSGEKDMETKKRRALKMRLDKYSVYLPVSVGPRQLFTFGDEER